MDIRRQAAQELKTEAEVSGRRAINHRIGRSSVVSTGNPSTSTVETDGRDLVEIAGGSDVPIEPLDYEEYVLQQQRLAGASRLLGNTDSVTEHLMDFPPDDIEVNVVPRKIRTLGHIVPEEPL